MKVLELFCGTKSISNAFKARGHEVFTVDWEKDPYHYKVYFDIKMPDVEIK